MSKETYKYPEDEYDEFAEDPDDGVSGAERLGFIDWDDDCYDDEDDDE